MKNEILSKRFILILSIIIIATALRIVPHWPNFSPVASIALFGGALFSRKYMAFIITFAIMFITDLFLGLHAYIIPVYLSFALVIGLGIIISRKINVASVIFGALGASVIFFLITNFSVWMLTPFYPKSFFGIVECYVAAIPFFHYTLIGNLFYSGVFFGIFYLASKRFPVLTQ